MKTFFLSILFLLLSGCQLAVEFDREKISENIGGSGGSKDPFQFPDFPLGGNGGNPFANFLQGGTGGELEIPDFPLGANGGDLHAGSMGGTGGQ